MEDNIWNDLEIAKLVVSMLTALVLIFVPYWIERVVRRLETINWTNQKVIERKLQVYDETMPLLNDLLCFYTRIGNWQELSPAQIKDIKRTLDKKIHITKPLFSDVFYAKYVFFINLCFLTYQGSGQHAKLRVNMDKYHESDSWNPKFSELFVMDKEKWTASNDICMAYEELGQIFVEELNLRYKK